MIMNNPTPWVVLIVICIVMVLIFGSIIGNCELLNPARASQEAIARSTFGSIDAQATQQILQATLEPIHATQEMQKQIAAATAMPLQMAATQLAENNKKDQISIAATENAIISADQSRAESQMFQKTQMAKQVSQADTDYMIRLTLEICLLICVLMISMAIIFWIVANSRAKEKNAQAKYLAEQRRNFELSIAIRKKINQSTFQKSSLLYSRKPVDREKGDDQEHQHLPLAN